MRRLTMGLIALAALVTAASALAIVGGTPDNGAHPYVGEAQQLQTGGTEHCSGFLVSATKFVTAAHCFPDGSRAQVTFDEDSRTSTNFVWGTVHVMPGFCFGCKTGTHKVDTNDVAVIVLDGDGAPDQGHATLVAPGSDSSLRTNQQIDLVGYGVSGIHADTITVFGSRQDATTKLNSVGDEYLKLLAGPGVCLGDSGGPDLLAGTNVVVAENSYSDGNPNCNGVSYSERLDSQAAQDFIASVN